MAKNMQIKDVEELANIKAVLLLKKVVDKLEKLQDEGIAVDNLDEIKKHLRVENKLVSESLSKNISEISSAMKEKFEEIPKPKITTAFKFEMPEIDMLVRKLEILNKKKFNPSIDIKAPDINIPEIKLPKIVVPEIKVPEIKTPNVTVNPNVDIDVKALLKALKPLKLLSHGAKSPIAVRMSDGKKFIKAMQDLAKAAEQQVVSFNQSSGITSDDLRSVVGTPKTFGHKKVTVTTSGTPVNVSSTSIACDEVYLTGDTDAGIVLVVGGDNTVDATTNNKNGLVIIPGNTATVIKTNDLKNLWVDAESNGGVLCVSYSSR